MAGKLKLYIGLLVLGLAVIGGGVWMLVKSPPEIEIPEGNPVIYEQRDYTRMGKYSYLYIYADGSVIHIQEKGLGVWSPQHPPTRTWRTAKLPLEQVDSLLGYLENSGLGGLGEYYLFPGEQVAPPGNGLGMSDMHYTITVNSGTLSKTVRASCYPSPDKGETYPGMPAPLNDIYGRLRAVAGITEEVYQEEISQ